MIGIVLFRHDLRLIDNPALFQACKNCEEIIPVFIHDTESLHPWENGAAFKVGLQEALASLDKGLREFGSRLLLIKGDTPQSLLELVKSLGVGGIYWNRRYTAEAIAADRQLKVALEEQGTPVHTFNGSLLVEPWLIQNKAGKPFRVFTPFWKNCQSSVKITAPLPMPDSIPSVKKPSPSCGPGELALTPQLSWIKEVKSHWQFNEQQGMALLEAFTDEQVSTYSAARDVLSKRGTSTLSPYLALGILSPRQIWWALQETVAHIPAKAKEAEAYLRQLFWREFAYHLLYHFPETATQPLQEKFTRFPWRDDQAALEMWQQGKTGYPVVDAGMRELWATGYMHNRARMITASFLVKDLLSPWQRGAEWFWDTLVDADLANNTLGWQWVAGCGADAAPYFRIFNPVRQGERFDPQGAYVRRWVPELSQLPDKYLHQPWAAPASVLETAGIVLGVNYPEPMVDHGEAREAALTAYNCIR